MSQQYRLAQAHILQCSDEADVFLESRGKGVANSTERNALVSGKVAQDAVDYRTNLLMMAVFLRVLEYYQGTIPRSTLVKGTDQED